MITEITNLKINLFSDMFINKIPKKDKVFQNEKNYSARS